MSIFDLPEELWSIILTKMSDQELYAFCDTNIDIRSTKCGENFWKDRYEQTFNKEEVDNHFRGLSWRSIYKIYTNDSYLVPVYNINDELLFSTRIFSYMTFTDLYERFFIEFTEPKFLGLFLLFTTGQALIIHKATKAIRYNREDYLRIKTVPTELKGHDYSLSHIEDTPLSGRKRFFRRSINDVYYGSRISLDNVLLTRYPPSKKIYYYPHFHPLDPDFFL